MDAIEETSEDKAARCYVIWSTEGRRDVAKTAQLSGIPERTIYYYKSRGNWEGRYNLEHELDPEHQVMVAAKLAKDSMPRVIEKMLWIAVGEKPLIKDGAVQYWPSGAPIMVAAADNKDALQAGRWLMQYGMLSAVDLMRDGHDTPLSMVPHITNGGQPMTPAQGASAILNANYTSHNTRGGKRR